MNKYNFRNANRWEKASYQTYLIEEMGCNRGLAESIVSDAHIGVLEGFQGSTPSYSGTILIVFHQNTSMYEVYQWAERGNLKPIEQEGDFSETT